ncbi:hypothetical protein [Reyranella sp.]|uniref:hypothetical protein n=1 Tax=Reyranella sp. TaxID=1929291 RepID=UPI003C7E2025
MCIVEKIIAEECLGGRWRDLFGGGAIYEAEMERAFIGVWGTRNAARLRRFLRERGADLTIRHDRPIGLRLRQWNATQGRRPRIRGMNKGGDAGAIDVT